MLKALCERSAFFVAIIFGMDNAEERKVEILYKNWRNEKALRTIVPIEVWFGSTEWHTESQWLLKALDIEKDAERDFALKDIESWSKK